MYNMNNIMITAYPSLAEWDRCVPLNVTLHGHKGKCCPVYVQTWAFTWGVLVLRYPNFFLGNGSR